MTTGEILDVLGGKSVIGSVESPLEMVQAVHRGLPWKAFETVGTALSVSQGELAGLLHITPRTLSRRKALGRLEPMESDRLARLARVIAHAVAVFESEGKARDWLTSENRALGGQKPLQLLDTDLGTREVDDVLGRIEHGIFG